jgi:hypothetical protein
MGELMRFESNLPMINWRAKGYFAYPDPPEDAALAEATLAAEPALLWLVALRNAKHGDFSLMPRLVPVCADDSRPILSKLASELTGDAAPDSVIDSVAQRLKRGSDNYEAGLQFCSVLNGRGLLADVPVLLDTLEAYLEIEDAEIISSFISRRLEEEPGPLSDHHEFDSYADYRRAVESRYQELVEQFGTDRILLLGGQPFGVLPLARKILTRAQEPYFPMQLRHKLEASTGIDCASFYREGEFQPLRATALVETFLEDPGSARFRGGQRYFFGHPIPD